MPLAVDDGDKTKTKQKYQFGSEVRSGKTKRNFPGEKPYNRLSSRKKNGHIQGLLKIKFTEFTKALNAKYGWKRR